MEDLDKLIIHETYFISVPLFPFPYPRINNIVTKVSSCLESLVIDLLFSGHTESMHVQEELLRHHALTLTYHLFEGILEMNWYGMVKLLVTDAFYDTFE